MKLLSVPTISVSITAYNHEKYIQEALDSVLEQKTEFKYEILIGEDDSTDKTREIVLKYKKKYPGKIRLFLNSRENVIKINGKETGRWNFINNLLHCEGEFVALLEGDDYWTDQYKLQKQIEYLYARPEYSTVFHWVDWYDESSKTFKKKKGPVELKGCYSIDDLLLHSNFIATCSVVYRNKLFNEFPSWYWNVGVGDFPLHILNAFSGCIGFINETMGVYRRHDSGAHGGNKNIDNLRRVIDVYKTIGSNLNLSSRRSYKHGISKHYYNLFNEVRNTIGFFPSIKYGIASFFYGDPNIKAELLKKFSSKIKNSVSFKQEK